ncbi:MAG: putative toxin-antitoxin system toxin component, PIN family [Saprospiraceae bacterium]|nr:putative toxin-antitoxin system toxin component, PIN family [Saprospiraceae bacterium]
MRIVMDTNALLIAIPKHSPYRPIFDALLAGSFKMIISNDILSEYEEIIAQKANSSIANNILELLKSLDNVEFQQIYYKWNLIEQDKDDNKFVDCAVAANADFLVTNDKHFNILQSIDFPPVKVLSIDAFLEMIQK